MTNKTDADDLWKEDVFGCRYCGEILKKQKTYCSEECRQRDSVWHSNDDW